MRFEILNPTDEHALVYATNLVVLVLAMVGVLFKWFAMGNSDPPLPAITFVAVCLANSIYLSRTGSASVGAWILITMLCLGLIGVGYSSGGFDGPVLILSPLIPILAVLLIDATAGLIAVVAVFVILSVYFYLQLGGYVPTNPNSEVGQLVGRYLAMLFSGLVSIWAAWAFSRTVGSLAVENERLANTDHMTGIANRRSIESKLAIEVRRAQRVDNWLSVIIMDVDHFKRFNDVNGHLAGDDCLIKVAQVIQASARRPADLVGRYGGEEFLAILPETNQVGAVKIAERIRTAILAMNISYEPGKPEVVSLTLGTVSCIGHLISGADDLLKLADEALYEGKDSGRNQVVSTVSGSEESDSEEKGKV